MQFCFSFARLHVPLLSLAPRTQSQDKDNQREHDSMALLSGAELVWNTVAECSMDVVKVLCSLAGSIYELLRAYCHVQVLSIQ